ncbi:MAG: hypothetical protein WBN03_20560, partial [Desulfobacterales bacterium]
KFSKNSRLLLNNLSLQKLKTPLFGYFLASSNGIHNPGYCSVQLFGQVGSRISHFPNRPIAK